MNKLIAIIIISTFLFTQSGFAYTLDKAQNLRKQTTAETPQDTRAISAAFGISSSEARATGGITAEDVVEEALSQDTTDGRFEELKEQLLQMLPLPGDVVAEITFARDFNPNPIVAKRAQELIEITGQEDTSPQGIPQDLDLSGISTNALVRMLSNETMRDEIAQELLLRAETYPNLVVNPLVGALANPERVEPAKELLLKISERNQKVVVEFINERLLKDYGDVFVNAANSLLERIQKRGSTVGARGAAVGKTFLVVTDNIPKTGRHTEKMIELVAEDSVSSLLNVNVVLLDISEKTVGNEQEIDIIKQVIREEALKISADRIVINIIDIALAAAIQNASVDIGVEVINIAGIEKEEAKKAIRASL